MKDPGIPAPGASGEYFSTEGSNAMLIDPAAVVSPDAELAADVEIGPFAVIERQVAIGKGCRIMAGAHIKAFTRLGTGNTVHTGAVLGDLPQDTAFSGAESYLVVGDHNRFREYATVHRGTKPGSTTVIGSHNFFMVNAHVAHNCRVGNHVIMVNNSALAGYVEVEDHATLSAGCMVHQFCRVGKYAFMRGLSGASRDVPPFCILDEIHVVRALNLVGLRRAGFSQERIRALRLSFEILFRSGTNLSHAAERVESEVPATDDVRYLLEFIRTAKRGVAVGKRGRNASGFSEHAEV